MDRTAAKLAGARFYEGSPCKFGHKGIRYTSTGNCYFCRRDQSRAAFSSRTFHGLAADLDVLETIWHAMQVARQSQLPPAPGLLNPWTATDPNAPPDPSDSGD